MMTRSSQSGVSIPRLHVWGHFCFLFPGISHCRLGRWVSLICLIVRDYIETMDGS